MPYFFALLLLTLLLTTDVAAGPDVDPVVDDALVSLTVLFLPWEGDEMVAQRADGSWIRLVKLAFTESKRQIPRLEIGFCR